VDPDRIEHAIDGGVRFLKSSLPGQSTGATALIGLALLESGVSADDPAMEKIIAVLRPASITLTDTYGLALAIMFLDRLGDPGDVPVIQSMGVRLLAGQNGAGGWAYQCPASGADEIQRLTTLQKNRVALRGSREAPKVVSPERKPRPELSAELLQQLNRLEPIRANGQSLGYRGMGDNSNTQFAILGLWVARRHGVPVEKTLAAAEQRFRGSQNQDGGWGYAPELGSTPTMTCAGLLGIAVAHGMANEILLRTSPLSVDEPKRAQKRPTRSDPGKDPAVLAGLEALGTALGVPAAVTKWPVPVIPRGHGNHVYYFFWSLERVAVAYDLRTIGHKDWYAWGAEILVASQAANGSWLGEHGEAVDTSFALLFLKRSNLVADLTASLKGRVKDPGEVALKSGGVGGKGLASKGLKPVFDLKDPSKPTLAAPGAPGDELAAETARLRAQLIQAAPEQQARLLSEYKDAKGVAYTQALAAAIPQLGKNQQGKARDALAERLMRMTAATLSARLKDSDAEMRAAAARACAGKMDAIHIPDLIELLADSEPRVARSARTALKYLSGGEDFGPGPEATPAERDRAIAAWKTWARSRKDSPSR
jgi:hypothetical protein